MTAPKWTRPTPPPAADMYRIARQAISDAQHAADPTYAALVLHEAYRRITADVEWWNRVRPALGVRRRELARTIAEGKP